VVSDDTEASLVESIVDFKAGFQTGAGEPLVQPGDESVEALESEDVDQEQIVTQKRG
jgi:F-type H+-transporting ATPase subunit alpha